MQIYLRLFLFASFLLVTKTAFAQSYPCLPKGIKPDTVVSATLASTPNLSKKVYVKDELKRLNTRCSKKKLVDGEKREIRFYRLSGCWGYLPPNAQEIHARQTKELAELRKKYTVITLTCNPSGVPRP